MWKTSDKSKSYESHNLIKFFAIMNYQRQNYGKRKIQKYGYIDMARHYCTNSLKKENELKSYEFTFRER